MSSFTLKYPYMNIFDKVTIHWISDLNKRVKIQHHMKIQELIQISFSIPLISAPQC